MTNVCGPGLFGHQLSRGGVVVLSPAFIRSPVGSPADGLVETVGGHLAGATVYRTDPRSGSDRGTVV